jgi:hypothetical protein
LLQTGALTEALLARAATDRVGGLAELQGLVAEHQIDRCESALEGLL